MLHLRTNAGTIVLFLFLSPRRRNRSQHQVKYLAPISPDKPSKVVQGDKSDNAHASNRLLQPTVCAKGKRSEGRAYRKRKNSGSETNENSDKSRERDRESSD